MPIHLPRRDGRCVEVDLLHEGAMRLCRWGAGLADVGEDLLTLIDDYLGQEWAETAFTDQ
ncbi:MAG: hypothetical protein OSB38_42165 [Paraburkholderia fungorum]|nr:hypothetical protein [Paraburkholderia fungorum]